MKIGDKQAAMVERYSVIVDVHERLEAILKKGERWPEVFLGERLDRNHVKGCISQVWIVVEFVYGRSKIRMSADVPLVRGLACLLCELYNNEDCKEMITFRSDLLAQTQVEELISSQRRHGYLQIEKKIRLAAVEQCGRIP